MKTIENFEKYLKFLYQQNKHEKLLDECLNFHSSLANEKLPLEWFCKVFCKLMIDKNDIAHKFIESVTTMSYTLLEMDPQNSVGLFCKAVLLSLNGHWLESKSLLEEGEYDALNYV